MAQGHYRLFSLCDLSSRGSTDFNGTSCENQLCAKINIFARDKKELRVTSDLKH